LKDFLKNKTKQGSVCAFFAMLVAMCLVGSYYLQYSQDLYWIKLFTYAMLFLCSTYVFASSVILKQNEEKLASLGLMIVLFFSFTENVFWIIKRAEWRMTAEAISLAFKAFGVITMIDVITFKKSLITKWWYILSGIILLLIPAVLKSLPLNITALTGSFLANNITAINVVFSSIVAVFGLFALILSVLQIIKKKYEFVAWSSLFYSLSVFMYGIFGVLRQVGTDAVQWSKNTAMLFELGVMLLLLAIVNYRKSSAEPKNVKKRK